MISLSQYLLQNNTDAHIHLFDHTGVISNFNELKDSKHIGFMDIDLLHVEKYELEDVIKYYDNFIKNYYNDNITLLATGKDSRTMIELYKKYPDKIKGFGEIKCYSRYMNHKLPYGNLQWFKELCEFNRTHKLPIFIHWYVYSKSRKNELDELLNEYPEIPFVLCHCGMSPFRNYKKQFEYVTELLLKHNNLYVDISYKPTNFFLENPEYAYSLRNKCIIGTDINNKSIKHNSYKEYVDMFNQLSLLELNCETTLKKIFNIS